MNEYESVIFVVYTNKFLQPQEIRKMKQYCFLTKDEVTVGDVIKSPDYSTLMQVTEVIPDTLYRYYDPGTGKLSASPASTKHKRIATIKVYDSILDKPIEQIIGYKV